MSPDSSRPDPASQARSTLDELGRLRERARAPAPPELHRRARTLLDAHFGPAEQQGPVEDGFGRGAVGLLADHTHYSDGFAVLAPMAWGTAVAARRAPEAPTRLVLAEASDAEDAEGDATTCRPSVGGSSSPPGEARVAQAVLDAFAPGPVEAAVVSAVPPACFDARLAALGGAAARAALALGGTEASPDARPTDAEERVRAALAEGRGVPFSRAPVQAAAHDATPPPNASSPRWLLADTAARERLAFEAPSEDTLRCGLIALGGTGETRAGGTLVQPPAFHHQRRRQADNALRVLRKDDGFAGLTSFRDLEHRDLDRAEALLPPALKPIARHLLTENRRTGKIVRATRHGDGQLLGALLLMSHTSLIDNWQGASPPLNAVVNAAEDADIDGLYGARQTGRGPCVLVAGRPAALPAFFRHATDLLDEQFDRPAETMLL